jgi:hypothetical protein
MNRGIYLVYLADVGRNEATFAVYTIFVSEPGGREIRVPSLANAEKVNDLVANLDRAVSVIRTWKEFYRWLGRENGGWAAFTIERELAPNWFSEEQRLDCDRLHDYPISFIDRHCMVEDLSPFKEIIGSSREENWYSELCRIADNFVITRQPIFDPAST